jgi:hypothetical protein
MDENVKLIQEWMSGNKDFAVGLELLQKVCRNKNIIDWVKRKGERKDTRDKIEYELQKILPIVEKEEVIPIPQFIIDIKERLAFIANRRSEVHRLMEELGDSNEAEVVEKRKGYVEEIEALTQEYNSLDSNKEDYFLNGKVPASPAGGKGSGNEMTDAQKVTRLNNLRASKSKWLKKDQKDVKVIARLLEIQTEIDTIEPLVAAFLKK